jgi:anaerobic magnesium-protoporphyrin IX monomethyl ester cyclase
MATFVVGFEEERDVDYLRGMRRLLSYDPDQIQLLYATPHHWTAFSDEEAGRRVIQPDLRKWDYKHQVLATRHVPPWRVLLWVKVIEAVMQGRPRSLLRLFAHPDRPIRDAIRWYYRIGQKVWPYEIAQFVLREKRTGHGSSLAAFQQGGRGASCRVPPALNRCNTLDEKRVCC